MGYGDAPAMRLGSREIGLGCRPYLIAEIGVNHEGSLSRAKELVELARQAGADAAKFQTYKAEKIAVRESPAYWNLEQESTTSQFELFKKYDSFRQTDYEYLADHCRRIGIDFLSTPFDLEAVEFLNPLCPFFKVASADITNVPLLRAVGRCRKPVVLSTGASNPKEIEFAIKVLDEAGADSVVVMHCILNYPCDYKASNLAMIGDLGRLFPGRFLGYSDHTRPTSDMFVLIAAWFAGAVVLEKHFTFDKSLLGNDHYHAMDAADCRRFREQCDFAELLLGQSKKKQALLEEESSRLYARRSIVAARQIQPGDVLKEGDLITLRPATGISANNWDSVLGRTVVRPVSNGTPLSWDDLS